jgi:hypothetical protein
VKYSGNQHTIKLHADGNITCNTHWKSMKLVQRPQRRGWNLWIFTSLGNVSLSRWDECSSHYVNTRIVEAHPKKFDLLQTPVTNTNLKTEAKLNSVTWVRERIIPKPEHAKTPPAAETHHTTTEKLQNTHE